MKATTRIAAGPLPALLLMLATAMPALGRPLVVVDSSLAGLSPGQIVDSDAAITLPAGARVTLIGPDGRNLHLHGPFDGKPRLAAPAKSDDPTLVSRLARLFRPTTADGAMPGGVRGEAPAPPPGAWSVDIAHGGTYCVAGIDGLRLWRQHAERPATMTIRRSDSGTSVTLEWSAGMAVQRWPTDLAVTTESKYLVRYEGDALPTVLVLRPLPAGLRNNAERAAWMGENGCAAQGRRLLQDDG